jgi:hypothetical protein
MPLIQCGMCNTEVWRSPSRVRAVNFCSYGCLGARKHQVRPRTYTEAICGFCSKIFKVDVTQIKAGNGKFCSKICMHENYSGDNSPKFKGGYIRPDGYMQVSHKSKQWLEHDLVYFLKTGIKASKELHVHHKDGNKLNNSIDNLELLTNNQHKQAHQVSESTRRKMSVSSSVKALNRTRDSKGKFV